MMTYRLLLSLCLLVPGGMAQADSGDSLGVVAQAKKRAQKRTKKKRRKTRKKQAVTVPVNVGLGPAVHWVTGPVQRDQEQHYGVKISLAAIIDQALIRQNQHKIPKRYRKMASRVDQVRLRPGPVVLVPDTLFISPRRDQTSMYGANWRFYGVHMPLGPLRIGTNLNLTYAYIESGNPALGETHFFRPGLDLNAELEIPLSKSVLVSGGWTSFFYPPQEVGGPVLALGDREASIWHIGQAFVQLHFRIPYTTRI